MKQQDFFQRYNYDLDKDHLGEGGFGKVFKAFDDTLDRYVALKVAEVKKGQESLSLLKEVELAEGLPTHRNIAHYENCYRFKTPHGTFDYGVLQYYAAGNLSQLIQEKKLTLEQKENIAKGIIAGIDHLHNNDIVHRDLKSSNILMSERSNGAFIPKVADFGLSKQVTNTQNSYFSNSFGGGSILYCAPEQLTTGQIRKNIDLWSLGVVLYELFLGELPFFPKTDLGSETGRVELVQLINNGDVPDELNKIPKSWRDVIKACLITDPTARVGSVNDIWTILSDEKPKKGSLFNKGANKDDTIVDPPLPSSPPLKPVSKLNFLYALIGVFGLIAAVFFFRQSQKERNVEDPIRLEVFQDRVTKKYGYKLDNEIVIKPLFDTANEFLEQKAKVAAGDSIYIIDTTGAIIELISIKEEPKDSDGDGIVDAKDKCPNERGMKSNNGCPKKEKPKDSDGDGILDVQDNCPNEPGLKSNNGCPKEGEEIFKVVEQMPRFPGCENELIDNKAKEDCAKQKMLQYIYKNLKYPAIARENGVEGMCVIQFVVDKTGGVSNVKIVRDIGADCGIAALSVVEGMNKLPQKWTPGKQGGKNVKVLYTLPVRFKKEEPEDSDGDGVDDTEDKCPYERGVKSNNGCPSKEEPIKLPTVILNIERNMVRISGGKFTMGCTSERKDWCEANEYPAHMVTLNSFNINKYEVTQEEWRAVMDSSPSKNNGCDKCPVEEVSWDDVQEFISKLNNLTGKRYRLPTEAEWEYAARGGNKSKGYDFAGNNVLSHVSWYEENSDSKTHVVGGKKANELGLYDMSGNVWEWCADWYDEDYYNNGAVSSPQGPKIGNRRIARGGSFNDNGWFNRVSYRIAARSTNSEHHLGFRLCRT